LCTKPSKCAVYTSFSLFCNKFFLQTQSIIVHIAAGDALNCASSALRWRRRRQAERSAYHCMCCKVVDNTLLYRNIGRHSATHTLLTHCII